MSCRYYERSAFIVIIAIRIKQKSSRHQQRRHITTIIITITITTTTRATSKQHLTLLQEILLRLRTDAAHCLVRACISVTKILARDSVALAD
jgi:hypothetical protein